MEVPFRLKRREEPAAAEAFLLFTADTTPLVDACVQLGETPSVFGVRGGFVVMPSRTETRSVPGAIKLRRLGGDLFIPADADLVPSLLPDEIATLSQQRGLVVLPGGEVLSFVPTPLPVTKWLAPTHVRRDEWQPFPPRPERAETLTVIERPAPPSSLMAVLGDGAPDDAEPLSGTGEGVPEDARPPGAGSTLGNIAANARLAAGSFLTWLGKQLGAEKLAKLGGDLARKALEAVPRLSEKVLGEQEAALREVLRQLQSGDIEKGLRRAPIAVGEPGEPAKIGTNARLGNRDPRYSLRDLIGGGGVGTAWLGGGDIWNELAREYRKLAEEATARGDYRRAAYLYGVLLRDLRSAANVLMAGGLCRDAALLYRDRLSDPLAAANAFERAGDHDEALRLFEKYEHFEKAAELLRRMGDEDRAVAFYVRAADQLAKRGHLLGAGDLIRTKAGRRDLAIGYYERGWNGITAENVTCGERLLDEHLVAENLPAVQELFGEAEARLADRAHDTGHFFNYALEVGDPFLPPEMRDDLTDRVRLLFASHLRSTANPADGTRLAAELFGQNHPWPGPVVRDATVAVREKNRVPVPATNPDHEPPVKLANGKVTAVGLARGTFDIVVATTEQVVLWQLDDNRIRLITDLHNGPVFALSVSLDGRTVFALQERGGVALWCFELTEGSFDITGLVAELPARFNPPVYLQPRPSFHNGEYQITVAAEDERQTYAGACLKAIPDLSFPRQGDDTMLLIRTADGARWDWTDRHVTHWPPEVPDRKELVEGSNYWSLSWGPRTANRGPALDWLTPDQNSLEVAGLTHDGCLHWSRITPADGANAVHEAHRPLPDTYTAVCLMRPGIIVAVTPRNDVHWFRVSGASLEITAKLSLSVPASVVALVARPVEYEVVAILADGSAVRFKKP